MIWIGIGNLPGLVNAGGRNQQAAISAIALSSIDQRRSCQHQASVVRQALKIGKMIGEQRLYPIQPAHLPSDQEIELMPRPPGFVSQKIGVDAA